MGFEQRMLDFGKRLGERVVKGYNYFTGKDKYGLANDLLITSPIAGSLGMYLEHGPTYALPLGGFLALNNYAHFLVNKNIKSLEEEASERSALPAELEKRRNLKTHSGLALMTSSTLFMTPSILFEGSINKPLVFSSIFLWGLADLAVGVENNPTKRKNVFSRGKSKLTELLQRGRKEQFKPLPGLG